MTRRDHPLHRDSSLDDTGVHDRFRDGHEDALLRVRGWVEGVIHLGRWNFDDPQGVAQDVMVRLLQAVRSGRFEARSRFRTFVFSVAKHTCIDVYRRERLRRRLETPDAPVSEPLDPGADPGARLDREERRALLEYVVQRLPSECRRLWDLVYVEGLGAAVVGERLGITAGNARVRAHRCMEKARAIGRVFFAGGEAGA